MGLINTLRYDWVEEGTYSRNMSLLQLNTVIVPATPTTALALTVYSSVVFKVVNVSCVVMFAVESE